MKDAHHTQLMWSHDLGDNLGMWSPLPFSFTQEFTFGITGNHVAGLKESVKWKKNFPEKGQL